MLVTQVELKEGKITKEVNEIIVRRTEPIIVLYANWYKEDPKGLIRSFLNKDSTKMIACLIIFTCKKNGLLKELEGKDFSEKMERSFEQFLNHHVGSN